jgi:hypothetical protein
VTEWWSAGAASRHPFAAANAASRNELTAGGSGDERVVGVDALARDTGSSPRWCLSFTPERARAS